MSLYIFVEGPDGAGKTTFIEGLKHKIGNDSFGNPNYKTKHFGVPADPETQVGMYIREMAFEPFEVIIFDRCWYSDMVYGPIMRNQESLSEADCHLLEQFVQSIGKGIVYYLTSDSDTLWDRCQQRGEDYIESKTKLDRIRRKYERVLSKTTLPIIKITT